MSSREEFFVREYVIGGVVSFCGGLFARAGVDPEGELIKFIISKSPINPFLIQLLAGLISIAIPVIFLSKIYSLVGILGIFAVIIAFIGGLITESSPLFGVFLVIFAINLPKIVKKIESYQIPTFN